MPNDPTNVDWDGLVARDGPAVWRAVRRLVGNDADAEDVFQETFIAALELARKEPVRQWRSLLLRLGHARAIDRLRQRYRRGAREGLADEASADGDVEAVASDRPLPHELASAAELSARLRDALGNLPDKQAAVFTLFCLEGWTYQEIAQHLDASVDAVGVLLHRARAKLKAALGERTEGRRQK